MRKLTDREIGYLVALGISLGLSLFGLIVVAFVEFVLL